MTLPSRRACQYREFAAKMWLELDDAADAIGPVPDLAENCLRAFSAEAESLIQQECWCRGEIAHRSCPLDATLRYRRALQEIAKETGTPYARIAQEALDGVDSLTTTKSGPRRANDRAHGTGN